MSALVKDAIRKLLIVICEMWLFDSREQVDRGNDRGDWVTFWIYPREVEWKDSRLGEDKRIRVEFTIEERKP